MNNVLFVGGSTPLAKEIIKLTKFKHFNLSNNYIFTNDVTNIKSLSKLVLNYDNTFFDSLIFTASINNSKRKLISGLRLNFFIPIVLLTKFNFKNIIFINTYWTLREYKKFNLYIFYKKITNVLFMLFNLKKKFVYLSIFVGDMYYQNDRRDKLHVYLHENENKKSITTLSIEEKPIYPIFSETISSFIKEILSNKQIFSKGNYLINAFNNKMKLCDYINLFKKVRKKNFIVKYGKIKSYKKIKHKTYSFYLIDFRSKQNLVNYFKSLE